MRYLLITLLFIFSNSYLNAQKDLSIDFLTDIQHVSNNLRTGVSSDVRVKGIIATKFGASFSFRIFDEKLFKTGIRYMTLGEEYSSTPSTEFGVLNSPGSQNPTFTPVFIDYNRKHRFIEIPLVFRHEFRKKNICPYFEIGLSSLFYLNTKTTFDKRNGKSITVSDLSDHHLEFKKRQLLFNFSFGISHNTSNSLQLYVQPNLQCQLTELLDSNNSGIIYGKYYSFGLEFGVRRQFGSYFSKEKS